MLAVTLIASLSACSAQKRATDKVRDIEFTVMEEKKEDTIERYFFSMSDELKEYLNEL